MLNKSFPAFSPLLFAVFGASGQTSQVGTSPELGLWPKALQQEHVPLCRSCGRGGADRGAPGEHMRQPQGELWSSLQVWARTRQVWVLGYCLAESHQYGLCFPDAHGPDATAGNTPPCCHEGQAAVAIPATSFRLPFSQPASA
jgi:hypothetical protein